MHSHYLLSGKKYNLIYGFLGCIFDRAVSPFAAMIVTYKLLVSVSYFNFS